VVSVGILSSFYLYWNTVQVAVLAVKTVPSRGTVLQETKSPLRLR